MNDLDVLVIGGGISGLSTAWWLARSGLSVSVWERDARAGGQIRTDSSHGFLTERSAALVMNFRPDVSRFMEEAGLSELKQARSTQSEANRYLLRNGRLMAVPMKLPRMLPCMLRP